MKLRRIAEHLKRQHWTAYAIDLVIVVVGVFIGMQVSTWNDARNLDQKKAAAIARMHAESEQDIAYLQRRMDVLTGDAALRTEALRRLSASDWKGADSGKMTDALDSLGLAPALSPPRGVYDELISTGMYAEIGDARVRDSISVYIASVEFAQKQIDFVRSDLVNRSFRQQFAGAQMVFDPAAPRQARWVYDFPALSADRAFIASALQDNVDRIAQAQWTAITLKKALAMCAEISRADGRPCKTEESRKP